MNSDDPESEEIYDYVDDHCVNLILDGKGDTTVRPCSPERLPFLKAEREKLIRWGKLPPEAHDGDPKPPNGKERAS